MGWLSRVLLLAEVKDSGSVATVGKETFSGFSLSSGSLIHPTLTSTSCPLLESYGLGFCLSRGGGDVYVTGSTRMTCVPVWAKEG